VTAKDVGTGRDQKISITGSSGLSEEEIERMRQEAEEHAEEDRAVKEKTETHNQLDSLIYQTEKLLNENGDKIPEDKKGPVEMLIADAKKALESGDLDQMKAAFDKLQNDKGLQEAVAEMYAQAQAEGTPPPDGAAESGEEPPVQDKADDDSVVDADFEMVDDEKDKG